MAKNGKDDTTGFLVIVGIVVLLILLPLVPIIFGIITIINWFKLRKKEKEYPNKTETDFWLNEQEKEHFKEMSENIPIAFRNVMNARNAGEEENISKNQNGSFSNRSNRGKEINSIINENQSYLDNNLWRIKLLESKPINDWQNMRKIYANFKASSYTILIWFFAFYITFSQYFKKPLLSLSEIYSHYVYGTTTYISLKDEWQNKLLITLGITAVITLIGYFLMKYVGKYMFANKYPKPQKVTKHNIDEFSKPLNAL
tara:strand:+ start:114 stop:884 length:771 start_codon:yes stop_codon:yes gene_type:complete